MPYKDPSPQDPTALMGVELPGDEQSTIEMAYTFAEELALAGYDGAHILSLFRKPFYAGPHEVYRRVGEQAVQRIIDEVVSVYGRVKIHVHDARAETSYRVDAHSGRIVTVKE